MLVLVWEGGGWGGGIVVDDVLLLLLLGGGGVRCEKGWMGGRGFVLVRRYSVHFGFTVVQHDVHDIMHVDFLNLFP